jgi:hypothetical protein
VCPHVAGETETQMCNKQPCPASCVGTFTPWSGACPTCGTKVGGKAFVQLLRLCTAVEFRPITLPEMRLVWFQPFESLKCEISWFQNLICFAFKRVWSTRTASTLHRGRDEDGPHLHRGKVRARRRRGVRVPRRPRGREAVRGGDGRVGTPGCQISYMDHTGCHQLDRVLTAK